MGAISGEQRIGEVELALPLRLEASALLPVENGQEDERLEDSALSAAYEALNQSLDGGRLSDLARATKRVYSTSPHWYGIQCRWIPLKWRCGQPGEVRICRHRRGSSPPRVEFSDLGVVLSSTCHCTSPSRICTQLKIYPH